MDMPAQTALLCTALLLLKRKSLNEPSATVNSEDFAAASRVQVTLAYSDCLENFYKQNHPEYALAGMKGQQIFSEWIDRLCTEPGITPKFSCEIASLDSFTQTLSEDANISSRLQITYELTEPSEGIDTRKFVWGPIPLEEFAGCDPEVRLTGAANIRALDDADNVVWTGALARTQLAIGKSYSSGCIEVEVEPSE